MHVHVYVYAHVYISACMWQRTTLSDVLRDTANFFEIGFSQAWSTEIKLADKFQEPSRLCLYSTGTTLPPRSASDVAVYGLTLGPCAWEARHFLTELSFWWPQC